MRTAREWNVLPAHMLPEQYILGLFKGFFKIMNAKTLTILVILVTNFRICQSIRYDNYTLYNVMATDMVHLKFLQSMESQQYIDCKFWRQPYKLYEYIQFMVNKYDLDLFKERMHHFHLNAFVLQQDVQSLFDNQFIQKYQRFRTDSFTWAQYHSLEDIYQWLNDIVVKYPSIVSLETIGKSVEGRDIYAVEIKKNKQDVQKVLVEGGIHGHEWISPAFVTYLINEILRAEANGDSRLILLSRKYHWLFVPMLNPDGYSFNQREDRLWRKNRKSTGAGIGVDLNRNFDYNFGLYDTSTDPNNDFYGGPKPFSEPETIAFSNYVAKKHEKLKFFFSFHGYGQMIIIPYSDRINHIDNYPEMENYAKQAVIKIYSQNRMKYSVGSTFDTLGTQISGESASWVKKTYKIPYVFAFILRDNGTYGYALPPDQILPTCKETLAGLVELMTARPRALSSNLFSTACDVTTSLQLIFIGVFLAFK